MEQALEFEIGPARVLVGADHIDRIMEVELTLLPLAKRWIGGVAVDAEDTLLVVDLAVGTPAALGRTRCAIFRTSSQRGVRWGIRIDSARNLVAMKRLPVRPNEVPTEWPEWVGGALLNGDAVVACIDVPRMVRGLET